MKLLLMTDPILRKVCAPVTLDELDYVKSLVPDMTKVMQDEGGIGLAANQVGISKRFFIMKLKATDTIQLVVNPEIMALGPTAPTEEGCLSIPGVSAQTERAQRVLVRFLDENGVEKTLELEGIEAVAIQHEVDHLDGKLYIDMLKPLRRTMVMDKFRKYVKMSGRV